MFPTLNTNDKNLIRATMAQFDIFYLPVDPGPGECPNCGGIGSLMFRTTSRGIFPSVGLGAVGFWDEENKGWRKIEETMSFVCPVCSKPTDWSAFLLSKSGLLAEEYDWDIELIKALKGKERVYLEFSNLISKFPLVGSFGILTGTYGTGKTGALKSLVAAACKHGISAKYLTAEKLLTMIRATFDAGQSELAFIDELSKIRVLAIDEVDVIGNSAWAEATLRMIIDERYSGRQRVSTWFATNDPNNLWPYLASRLADGAVIPISGISMRGPTAPRPHDMSLPDSDDPGW